MQLKMLRSGIQHSWNRMPTIIKAILSGFIVSSIGIAVWTADISLFPMPLAIPLMMIPLWIYWKYFSGKWGSKTTRANRSDQFRSEIITTKVWKWGLVGGLLFVLIVQSSFVITFRTMEMPAGYTSGYPQIESLPRWLAWSAIIMSSVVAGICEETGFRGYMQVPLEIQYGPVKGIFIVAIAFTAIHLSKVWAAPIVPNIFFASLLLGVLAYKTGSLIPGIIGHSILDIFDYSFWWTNLLGRAARPTIFKTGLDGHFILWCTLFVAATVGFCWAIAKLGSARRQSQDLVTGCA